MTYTATATNLAWWSGVYCSRLGAENSLQVVFNEPAKEELACVGVECYAMFLQYLYQVLNDELKHVLECRFYLFATLDEVYEKMLE